MAIMMDPGATFNFKKVTHYLCIIKLCKLHQVNLFKVGINNLVNEKQYSFPYPCW